jgi:hypothetical protein
MKGNTPRPEVPGATPQKPYEAPVLKEFGTIAELTKVTASNNTNKDNTPANTKT